MNKRTVVATVAVLAVIVLSGALLVLMLNYAQTNGRDIERLNDISVTRLALERYFFYRHSYPLALAPLALGASGVRALGDSDIGWQNTPDGCGEVFISSAPGDPLSAQGWQYYYTGNGETYNLTFQLEKGDSGLAPGQHQAAPAGIE